MNTQTTFFTGPSGPPHIRQSFRRVRGLAASGIALCAVVFLLCTFRLYTTPDFDTDIYNSILHPASPIHSGLSDPPFGFYADRLANPFEATSGVKDDVHHQLSEDGPLTESDSRHNPNLAEVHHGLADEDAAEEKDATDAAIFVDHELSEAKLDSATAIDLSIPTISTDDAISSAKQPLHISEEPSRLHIPTSNAALVAAANPNNLTTTIVVGRTDNGANGTSWLFDDLHDITNAAIYIVDDTAAPLHLDVNKGREAMVYIKYIVEHYDELSDITVFFHSGRKAWHNNMLFDKDGASMINNLRRQHVKDVGYFNLRCELYPGCPRWVLWNATREENLAYHPERFNDLFSANLWDQMFPDRTHDPVYLAQACCSQYALSREKIRSRPLSDYVRIQEVIATSRISDGYLGRVFEYVWQFLWLDTAEHCPSMVDCYCSGYGVCLEGDDATALVEWNGAKTSEDDLMTELGNYDRLNCNAIEDVMDRRECKKANPVLPRLGENRRKAGSLMEENLKKYIITQS